MFEQPCVCANMLADSAADWHTAEHTSHFTDIHRAVAEIVAIDFSLKDTVPYTGRSQLVSIKNMPHNQSHDQYCTII